MKLLVTGGAGFIGSNFIHYWMKGHPEDKLVNLDKLTYAGNPNNLKDVAESPNYTFIKGDICDFSLVLKTLEYHEIDTVVHFAAQSHVDRSVMLQKYGTLELGPEKLFTEALNDDFIINNVWGTNVLLQAVKYYWGNNGSMNGKRFHHVSTDEVFGALSLDDPNKFHEGTPYAPRSPYAASKAASDHLVRSYIISFGFPATISNTANNFGPYMYPEKLLPLAITNLLEGKKVPIYGDGKYVRDWLFVDDHCHAIELILSKGKVGETYCIGAAHEEVNNLELIKKVLALLGKDESSLEYVKDRPGHDRRYALDSSKAKRELGYEPKHDLETNLEKMVNWYKDNTWWWKPIKSGEFKEWYRKQYEER